jgi:chromosome segregation ATPase
MSSRPTKRPLDIGAVKRVMSNMLFEAVGANRIRPSMPIGTEVDRQKIEILGKALGLLQDNRDMAHTESMKAEDTVREMATEKKSIRDKIAELKAQIEYKKHILDKTATKNRSRGKYHEEVVTIEGQSQNTNRQAARILKEDAKHQLDEAYRLRDKLLSSGRGGATIPPQVKLKIEERMAEVEAKVERDIDANTRTAANLEENLGHEHRTMNTQHLRIEETKYTLGEIKKESEELDRDVEREIDSKNVDINASAKQLKETLKEKQDLKWRIGSLESEVNKLEFQKNKYELEVNVRYLKDNKGDIVEKLDRRIEDARYNEENIRSLIVHAKGIHLDVGFIKQLDIQGDRNHRLRQLQDDLRYKKQNEARTREEVMDLNQKLNAIGEVNIDTKAYSHEENYSQLLQDLNIGYTDVVQSVKDHLTANAAILRKEKEIKEMEARITIIDLEALEEEYQRLRILYDTDSEILRDLEERYSLIHDRLIRLRARLREINDLLRSLEERLETARFEIEDAERKYKLIKIPKKIEYVVNERVEDVLIRKKYLTKENKISEQQYAMEKKNRASGRIVGREHYKPSADELESITPIGSKVRIYADKQDGHYRYGSLKFFFIKGEDGEYYVNHEGTRMTFDDFITLNEAQERKRSNKSSAYNVEHGRIDDEEADAEVGSEVEGVRSNKMNSGNYQRR